MYKWDAVEAVDLIEREDVTAVAGVPTTMFQLLEVAHAQGRELPSLASVSSGATLVPPELVRRIDTQLASRAAPTNGYGLTETSGAAIANGGKAYIDRPDSVGTVISPVIEVKIVGADGTDLATRRGRRDLAEGPDGRARATSTTPRRRPRPSRTDGSRPVTSAGSTTRATCMSSIG